VSEQRPQRHPGHRGGGVGHVPGQLVPDRELPGVGQAEHGQRDGQLGDRGDGEEAARRERPARPIGADHELLDRSAGTGHGDRHARRRTGLDVRAEQRSQGPIEAHDQQG
jgi:hypothetical protein